VSITLNPGGVASGLRAMQHAGKLLSGSLERLSTGKRINRASDDPSGIVVVDDFKVEQRQIEKKIDSLSREQYRLSAFDGAHSVVNDLLIDLNATVVSAANRDALSKEEIEGLQLEADSIIQTINYLSGSTRFNGELVLRGSGAGDAGRQTTNVEREGGKIESVTYSLQSLASGGTLNLIDGDLEKAQEIAKSALAGSSGLRAAYGARSKSIDNEIDELQIRFENISAARSKIEDTDYASETANLVRAQVLQSAAQYTVQIAQQQNSDLIMKLLK